MKNIKETRPLDYYLQLEYPLTVYRAEEGGYVVELEDLPGCITEGENLEEVSQKIDEVRCAWIETAYEDGMEIPLPRTEHEYSGRFVVRMPKYLHRRLAEQATRESISLNQYVQTVLSAGTSIEARKIEELGVILRQLEIRLTDMTRQGSAYLPPYSLPKWETTKEYVPSGISKFIETEAGGLLAL